MSVRSRLGPRLDLEGLGTELRERVQRLDGTLGDLMGGMGAPENFDPSVCLAPGIPRVRPVLVLLSERAARAHVKGDASDVSDHEVTEDVAAAEDEPAKDSDAGRKEILTLAGHSREVTSVAFSPGDGRYILTASVDGKAILWLTMAWEAPPKDGTGVAAAAE